MKIALYFEDKGFNNIDLSNPEDGNNGIGGTQFCFVMLAYQLLKKNEIDKVTIFHFNKNRLPNGINDVIISSREEMLKILHSDSQYILIFKAVDDYKFLEEIEALKIRSIAWAHNYIYDKLLNVMNNNEYVKRVIFVGKEQYDRYIDHDIIKKSSYIFNMYYSKGDKLRNIPEVPAVTYTGSLVYAKGFHVLAAMWKEIIKEVPNAQLYVIGSGQLYDRSSKLGKYNIAEEKYENSFMPYLVENGDIMPSVHFLGVLGSEKKDIYKITTVGIINPTARTETFGISAVEMEAFGIPVVTKKANGLLDVIVNNKTGYLCYTPKQMKDKIIYLLKNKKINIEMGNNAKGFVEKSFSPELIVEIWIAIFEDIYNDRAAKYVKPAGNYSNNVKWFRIIIRRLKKLGMPLLSTIDLECRIKNLITKMR